MIGILAVGLLKSQQFPVATSEIKLSWKDGVSLAECGKKRGY